MIVRDEPSEDFVTPSACNRYREEFATENLPKRCCPFCGREGKSWGAYFRSDVRHWAKPRVIASFGGARTGLGLGLAEAVDSRDKIGEDFGARLEVWCSRF